VHNQYLTNETLVNGTSTVSDGNTQTSSNGDAKQKQKKLFWDLDENLRFCEFLNFLIKFSEFKSILLQISLSKTVVIIYLYVLLWLLVDMSLM